MRYWWVNQNQTYRKEIGGGYMWSPKRNRDEGRNRFYDNMRAVAPGDLVFSYVDTRIIAIGRITSIAYECPRPTEFGAIGQQWNEIGWRVDVRYTRLERQIRPKEHMALIRRHLPMKYSPLKPDGNGLQNVYLASIPDAMAGLLMELIGDEAIALTRMMVRDKPDTEFIGSLEIKEAWEQVQVQQIQSASNIPPTEKQRLVMARQGQGLYREAVCEIEHTCRITRIGNPKYLIASHIKPWRHSENHERLDGENGLLLCPNIDLLFDRGLISFEDNGEVLVSPAADMTVLPKMAVDVKKVMNVGGFSSGQKKYLDYHRDRIFLQVAG